MAALRSGRLAFSAVDRACGRFAFDATGATRVPELEIIDQDAPAVIASAPKAEAPVFPPFLIVTETVAVVEAPALSLTVATIVYVPGVA